MVNRRRLTILEKETLRKVCAGKTNKEIAAELGTEEHCVKNRVRSGLHRLGLRHSRQLIPLAAEIAQILNK